MGQPCNPIFESNRKCASKKKQLKEILLFNISTTFILTFILTGSPFFIKRPHSSLFLPRSWGLYIAIMSCIELIGFHHTMKCQQIAPKQSKYCSVWVNNLGSLVAPFHVRPKPNMKVTNTCVTFECLLIIRFFLLLKTHKWLCRTPCEFNF